MNKIILFCFSLIMCACSVNTRYLAENTTVSSGQVPIQIPKLTRTPEPTATKNTSQPTPTAILFSSPTWLPSATEMMPEENSEFDTLPTRTPLTHPPLANVEYRVTNWTAENANQLISKLQKYPDGLVDYIDRGYHDSGYYAAYDYARFALAEALLRFPGSSYEERWKWDMAYDMAQYGHQDVNQTYADLIAQALNKGEATIENLENWFEEHEKRLRFALMPLPSPRGYQASYLAEIADQYRSTGVYSWIVKGSTYSVFPLKSCQDCAYGYGDFGFSSSSGIAFYIEDVTGDGIAEVLTEHMFFPGSGDALTTNFDIFDISQVPYRRIQFSPPPRIIGERSWSILPDDGNGPGFLFEYVLNSWVCPYIENRDEYRLQDNDFILVHRTNPGPSELEGEYGNCQDFYFGTLLYGLKKGDVPILDDLEQWVQKYPYSDMPLGLWGDEEQSPDDRDGIRFAIGIYLAVNNEWEAAVLQMEKIISNPVIPSSRWIVIAQRFLDSYQKPADLPNACASIGICYELLGVGKLVEIYTHQSVESNIVEYLQSNGTPIIDQGVVDINQDGQTDYWITVEYPEDDYSDYSDTWFLLYQDQGYKTFYLGETKDNQSLTVEYLPAFQDCHVIATNVDTTGGKFVLCQTDNTSDVYLDDFYSYLRSTVYSRSDEFEKILLSGRLGEGIDNIIQETKPFIDELEQLDVWSFPGFDSSIPRWYYLLGLYYELTGDQETAAQYYLHIWSYYPDSPYAIMVEAKLQPVP